MAKRVFTIRNIDRGTVLAPRARLASGIVDRFLGLMGRSSVGDGGGLVLRRSSSIHSCFMRFRFDAIFIDADGKVVRVVPAMRPWRIAFGGRGARDTLELPAGTASSTLTEAGDTLSLEPL